MMANYGSFYVQLTQLSRSLFDNLSLYIEYIRLNISISKKTRFKRKTIFLSIQFITAMISKNMLYYLWTLIFLLIPVSCIESAEKSNSSDGLIFAQIVSRTNI